MPRKNELSTETTEATLLDFIVPEKVAAFCEQYRPLTEWMEGCDTYTDYQLRSYFKAVVCPLGDPLAIYIQQLAANGFRFHNDACGEPVIYAMPK